MKTDGCGIKFGSSTELVLYECEPAMRSHKELFSLKDECYVEFSGDLNDIILLSVQEGLTRLHTVTGWETLVRISLWTTRSPAIGDALGLLKKCGVGEAELAPFIRADVNDIFPWLYYGKRFDILRKVCNTAKARIEQKIDRKKLLIYSHLISGETERIVSSSL